MFCFLFFSVRNFLNRILGKCPFFLVCFPSGDTVFKCPVINFAEYYASRIKGQTYVYSFEHRVSTNGWPQWIGVAHGYELEVFFGLPWFMQIYTNEERTLSDDVMTRISNFAKTGLVLIWSLIFSLLHFSRVMFQNTLKQLNYAQRKGR